MPFMYKMTERLLVAFVTAFVILVTHPASVGALSIGEPNLAALFERCHGVLAASGDVAKTLLSHLVTAGQGILPPWVVKDLVWGAPGSGLQRALYAVCCKPVVATVTLWCSCLARLRTVGLLLLVVYPLLLTASCLIAALFACRSLAGVLGRLAARTSSVGWRCCCKLYSPWELGVCLRKPVVIVHLHLNCLQHRASRFISLFKTTWIKAKAKNVAGFFQRSLSLLRAVFCQQLGSMTSVCRQLMSRLASRWRTFWRDVTSVCRQLRSSLASRWSTVWRHVTSPSFKAAITSPPFIHASLPLYPPLPAGHLVYVPFSLLAHRVPTRSAWSQTEPLNRRLTADLSPESLELSGGKTTPPSPAHSSSSSAASQEEADVKFTLYEDKVDESGGGSYHHQHHHQQQQRHLHSGGSCYPSNGVSVSSATLGATPLHYSCKSAKEIYNQGHVIALTTTSRPQLGDPAVTTSSQAACTLTAIPVLTPEVQCRSLCPDEGPGATVVPTSGQGAERGQEDSNPSRRCQRNNGQVGGAHYANRDSGTWSNDTPESEDDLLDDHVTCPPGEGHAADPDTAGHGVLRTALEDSADVAPASASRCPQLQPSGCRDEGVAKVLAVGDGGGKESEGGQGEEEEEEDNESLEDYSISHNVPSTCPSPSLVSPNPQPASPRVGEALEGRGQCWGLGSASQAGRSLPLDVHKPGGRYLGPYTLAVDLTPSPGTEYLTLTDTLAAAPALTPPVSGSGPVAAPGGNNNSQSKVARRPRKLPEIPRKHQGLAAASASNVRSIYDEIQEALIREVGDDVFEASSAGGEWDPAVQYPYIHKHMGHLFDKKRLLIGYATRPAADRNASTSSSSVTSEAGPTPGPRADRSRTASTSSSSLASEGGAVTGGEERQGAATPLSRPLGGACAAATTTVVTQHADRRRKNSDGDGSRRHTSSTMATAYHDLEVTHRGMHRFLPRHADEVQIGIGDPIHVIREYDDLWCEGVNLRSGERGIFPAMFANDLKFLEDSDGDDEHWKFTMRFLGSVEVASSSGDFALCQAINKVAQQGRIKTASVCTLEINQYGIRMLDKSNEGHQSQKFTNFYALKNISFCGTHPNNNRYFAFITKHPRELRFACHVFHSDKSTHRARDALGNAFRRFYQEYMAFTHPTEDIWIE